jgi:glycosyltransferase involved in cell wall biosynthesis
MSVTQGELTSVFRIILINKFLYPFGGVESCVFDQLQLLTQHGHHVIPFGMKHRCNISSEWKDYFVSEVDYTNNSISSRLHSALRSLYSTEARRKIADLITASKPHIAHVHHIYNQISPSILYELHNRGIPIIQTIHDYKPICPNAKLYIPKTQEICYRCQHHRYYNSVTHDCGSYGLPSSILIALEAYLEHLTKPYLRKVSYFITPSNFLRNQLIKAGFPENKVEVIHNFIDTSSYQVTESGKYIVYMGRLESYKGVQILIEAARHLPSLTFKIAGTGTYENTLKQRAIGLNNVTFVGQLDKTSVRQLLAEAMCLVVPSIWHDIAPMVMLEAFACGKPAIATRMGGLTEMTQGNGLLVEPNSWEDLAEKITQLNSSPTLRHNLGSSARKYVDAEYSPDSYYKKISQIYQRVVPNQVVYPAPLHTLSRGDK